MAVTLDDIGLSHDELQARVVERAAKELLKASAVDEDGGHYDENSPLARKLLKECQSRIDAQVAAFCEQHILPQASKYLENVCLQETTKWGEKRGAPLTFKEYIVMRAEAWLTEPVNFEGEDEAHSRYSSWSANCTRVAYMVHEHLQYHIAGAVKKMLANANSALVEGLKKAVELKLDEIKEKLDVKVTTGR